MRGPAKVVTDASIIERVRRLNPNTAWRIKAKALVKDNQLLEALKLLVKHDDAHYKHVIAYQKWKASVNDLSIDELV